MKGETIVIEKIDVRDLPEKEIRFIQQLVDLLKEKTRISATKASGKTAGKRIKLPTFQLGAVQGSLSRREIYDHL